MIKKITDSNFTSEVLHSDKPVLVDFFASWCVPCRSMHPLMEELSTEDSFLVAEVDIDEAPELADRYSVLSVPTFLIFKNGELSNRLVGTQSRQNLTKLLQP